MKRTREEEDRSIYGKIIRKHGVSKILAIAILLPAKDFGYEGSSVANQ